MDGLQQKTPQPIVTTTTNRFNQNTNALLPSICLCGINHHRQTLTQKAVHALLKEIVARNMLMPNGKNHGTLIFKNACPRSFSSSVET
jgi:hypothetical protein